MTLEQAQRAKHQYITEQLNIQKGSKVLDMGCGWGPFLNYMKEKEAKAIGLTLSEGQCNACKKNGFEAYVKDVRTVTPQDYGIFDAVVSIGGFEHFCSLEEYKEGKQEMVYTDFFKTVYDLLPPGKRFYMQTMVFGKNMIDWKAMDLHANKNSDAYILAVLTKFFPGSWLPYGSEMVLKTADPYFKMINISSGRLDYIETITQWRKKLRKFNLKKYGLLLSILPRFIFNKELRYMLSFYLAKSNLKCFQRELLEHYRIVFEKK
jgi:cyclopropane-fatty-acyl-phospholipid synthase